MFNTDVFEQHLSIFISAVNASSTLKTTKENKHIMTLSLLEKQQKIVV
jgi:hypothetical protein